MCNIKEVFLIRLFSAAPVAGGSAPAGMKADLFVLLAPMLDDLADCEVVV